MGTTNAMFNNMKKLLLIFSLLFPVLLFGQGSQIGYYPTSFAPRDTDCVGLWQWGHTYNNGHSQTFKWTLDSAKAYFIRKGFKITAVDTLYLNGSSDSLVYEINSRRHALPISSGGSVSCGVPITGCTTSGVLYVNTGGDSLITSSGLTYDGSILKNVGQRIELTNPVTFNADFKADTNGFRGGDLGGTGNGMFAIIDDDSQIIELNAVNGYIHYGNTTNDVNGLVVKLDVTAGQWSLSDSGGTAILYDVATKTTAFTDNVELNAVKIADGTQSNGYVLTSDALGNTSWQTPSSGGVTSITTSNGILGGTITSTGNLRLDKPNIDSVGTVVSGVWHGSSIDTTYSNGVSNVMSTVSPIVVSTAGKTKFLTCPTCGTVTSVTGTSPIVSSGGTTPAISIDSTRLVRTDTFHISSAQILNCFSSPVTVLSAPGANKYYQLLSTEWIYTYGGSAYVFSNQIGLTEGTADFIFSDCFLFMAGASSAAFYPANGFACGFSGSFATNSAVQLAADGGNPTSGNGTLKVIISYKIISTN